MIDINNLSFGQRVDPKSGLVQSWFTHGALDWIAGQDWSDKVVFMWGAGAGDAWLAKQCKELHVVERNQDWLFKSSTNCAANGATNVTYYLRPCNDSSGMDEMYCAIPEGVKPDIFIVDDAYRYECIIKAIQQKPCTLIVDNYMQAFVFMSPPSEEALKPYDRLIFEQADHQDHDGVNKWKTAIFFIK